MKEERGVRYFKERGWIKKEVYVSNGESAGGKIKPLIKVEKK